MMIRACAAGLLLHAGGVAGLTLIGYAKPNPDLEAMASMSGPGWRSRLVEIVTTHGSPSDLRNLSSARGSPATQASPATQGKLFEMKRERSYQGEWPNLTAHQHPTTLTSASAPSCASTKWAVVTSIFQPTDAIKRLAQLPDWCTVVVGDLKGPQGKYLSSPRVVLLSPGDQQELGKRLRCVEHIPWNSFGRKNIGYLYAAAQGAETIFDIDDDNTPTADSVRSVLGIWDSTRVEARAVSGGVKANVYSLFTDSGHGALWPRGFPLGDIQGGANGSAMRSSAVSFVSSQLGVVQCLANGNPDVDAIYRLTGELPVQFKERQPAVLEPGTFAPFNAQATFWRRPAFAAMLLPVTVHGRVADIWRSYIAQPLLWGSNLSLAFVSPRVAVDSRNPHNLMADLEAEWPLYYKADALLNDLGSRRQEVSMPTFAEALFATYVHLYEYGIVELGDVGLAKAWVEDIIAITSRAPR